MMVVCEPKEHFWHEVCNW